MTQSVRIHIVDGGLDLLEVADLLETSTIEQLYEALFCAEEDQLLNLDVFDYDRAAGYEELWYRIHHEIYKRLRGTTTLSEDRLTDES